MDREHALAAALEQIDYAFGKRENMPPEMRARQAKHRLERLLPIREAMAKLAAADEAKDRDDQGWTEIDPTVAYIVAWLLRKDADSDRLLAMGRKAQEALEEAADHIESGELLANPQEMLWDLDDLIARLRSEADA